MRMGVRTGVRASAVAALCLALGACTADSATPGSATPDPPSSPAPPPATQAVAPGSVPPCPPWDAPPDYPEGPLQAGAVSLRICAGDDSVLHPPRFWAGIAAPSDALTTGVAALVEEVNGLPGWPDEPDQYCTQEGRPRIKYVFGYPDGSTRTVTHGYGSCHVLELAEPPDFPEPDGLTRLGAIAFGATVADALLAQRRTSAPPEEVPAAPGCVPNIAPQTPLPVQELELATAALCLLPDGRRYRRVDLDAATVARIDEVLTGGAADPEECPELPSAKVVAQSTWGDPVLLNISQCAIETWDEAGAGPEYRPLGPDLVADLLALPRGPWERQR